MSNISNMSSITGRTDNEHMNSSSLRQQHRRRQSRSSSLPSLGRQPSWHDTAPEKHTHHASIMHHLNSNEWHQQFLQQCLQRLQHRRDEIINDYRGLHESMEIDDDNREPVALPSTSQSLIVRSAIESQLQDWLDKRTTSNGSSSMMDIPNSFNRDNFSKNIERDIYHQMWTEYRNSSKE